MKEDSKYLPGLDVLRFLMAVTILIVHFPHFLIAEADASSDQSLPFRAFLSLIYQYGGFAVEIFWMISGIIFYHFYLQAIAVKKISFREFLFLRFSRLYPLHLLTLIGVAFLQYVFYQKFNKTFVYANNDGLHFILNFFMINFWNAKFGLSFNGPFWSVSVEMFVYIIFFVFAFMQLVSKKKNLFALVVLFFLFYALGIVSPFYECLLYFFAGCLLIQNLRWVKPIYIILSIAVVAGLLFVKYKTSLLPANPYLIRVFDCSVKLIIASVMVVVFSNIFSGTRGKIITVLRQLGNMTYASYMIHFPVQLILMLSFYGRGQDFFNNKLFFCSYLVLTVMTGFLSYQYFEMPVQNFLRKKMHLIKRAKNE